MLEDIKQKARFIIALIIILCIMALLFLGFFAADVAIKLGIQSATVSV